MATGSLGQGLPIGVGMALAGRYLDKLPYRVWVLCGDSEMAEGSIWEAFDKAAYYQLDNLTAIVDVNRLGQRGETELGWDMGAYRRRAGRSAGTRSRSTATTSPRSTGACAEAGRRRQPDRDPRQHDQGHGRRRGRGQGGLARPAAARPTWPSRALAELGGAACTCTSPSPRPGTRGHRRGTDAAAVALPRYEMSASKVATRKAYGEALVAARRAGPTWSRWTGRSATPPTPEEFAAAYPDRFFEMFIAEQQLIAAAVGLPVRG